MAVKRKSLAVSINQAKINESYNKFSEDVPVAGLYEISKSKHWYLKLIWAIVFTAFLALTAFFIYRVIEDFLEEPVITKVNDFTFNKLRYCILTESICNIQCFL